MERSTIEWDAKLYVSAIRRYENGCCGAQPGIWLFTFVGTALSLGHTVRGCVLTALLFGTAFLFWTYYPHDLPLPTLVKGYNPARPDNPVTTNYLPPATMQR
jgi:hypothetical protein